MAKKKLVRGKRDTSIPYSAQIGQAVSETKIIRSAFRVMMAMAIYVLYEKFEMTDEQVDKFNFHMSDLLDSYDRGYLYSIFDLDECMDEYGIGWDGHLPERIRPRRNGEINEGKDE